MTSRSAWAIIAVVAASLSSLYGMALYWFSQSPAFFPANALEMIILGSQLVRLLLVFSVGSLRRNGVIALDIFTAEILVLPALLVVTVAVGDKLYLHLAGDVLVVWGSAFLLVFPAFAIYKVGAMVQRGASLTTLIPSATSVFTVLVVFLSATLQSTTSVGLAGLTKLVSIALFGGETVAAPASVVTVAGVVLYLGLVAHSATGAKQASGRPDVVVAFPALGTAAALAWALFVGPASSDTILIFAVPSLVLISIMWLGARAE